MGPGHALVTLPRDVLQPSGKASGHILGDDVPLSADAAEAFMQPPFGSPQADGADHARGRRLCGLHGSVQLVGSNRVGLPRIAPAHGSIMSGIANQAAPERSELGHSLAFGLAGLRSGLGNPAQAS